MTASSKKKQSAVIAVVIAALLLFLWYLHLHPKRFGGVGSFVSTNIFGPATLSLMPGAPGEGGPPPPPGTVGGPETNSNELTAPQTNHPSPSTNPPVLNPAPAGSHQALSTNLLNTNGPETLIAVAPADLVQTPPGVTYASNVSDASAIAKRLGDASAKGGDIQISLSWNNYNDLDLHCIDPKGEEIWFSHRISNQTGGELDVDQNANAPFTSTPVENIFWPEGGAPPGLYKIFVVYYSPRNGMNPAAPTAFTVRTVVRGWKTYFFKSTITFTGNQARKPICTLRYDPNNPDPSQRFGFVQ